MPENMTNEIIPVFLVFDTNMAFNNVGVCTLKMIIILTHIKVLLKISHHFRTKQIFTWTYKIVVYAEGRLRKLHWKIVETKHKIEI